ncbi:MAG TPA: 23S rRNA (pseudouridine(1915)-N(3))-methyltransferase RlmH [Burkholderiales bacterium]|nr:23S rRNA (pseudouridine(1915)-N(3))-methyltransferase RlmH [Burkholderiales bacterium]
MKLLVVAVGQRMPAWIDAGFDEYAKRMPREASLTLREIRAEPRADGAPVERAVQAEAKRIRAALPADALGVVLDERGKTCTTRELARRVERWLTEGRDVAFVIGGADGLADDMRRDADWLWSLSPLTLPHGLVRVVVAEQLYRAWTILKNHPYHRA